MKRFGKLKIILSLAGILFAGVVTGMFVSFQVARHMMPSQSRMADRWGGELQSRLDLSPEQMQKVRPFITNAIGNFKITLGNDALTALSNCYSQIAGVLTPEQKTKFEKVDKEQREFIQRAFGESKPARP
jgi:Spy/CpxP family protein refolding chaperone